MMHSVCTSRDRQGTNESLVYTTVFGCVLCGGVAFRLRLLLLCTSYLSTRPAERERERERESRLHLPSSLLLCVFAPSNVSRAPAAKETATSFVLLLVVRFPFLCSLNGESSRLGYGELR